MTVTKAQPTKTRFLHVPVSADFLKRVGMEAKARDLHVRDFVVKAIELSMKGGKRNGKESR